MEHIGRDLFEDMTTGERRGGRVRRRRGEEESERQSRTNRGEETKRKTKKGAPCIKRAMMMLLSGGHGNLVRTRVCVWGLCHLVLVKPPRGGKTRQPLRTDGRAGRDHPSSANDGGPNEQVVNERGP